MKGRGRETKQLSIPPTTLTSNSISSTSLDRESVALEITQRKFSLEFADRNGEEVRKKKCQF